MITKQDTSITITTATTTTESSNYLAVDYKFLDGAQHIMRANASKDHKLISDLPAKCNPAKMKKIKKDKKMNKKNGIVWIKKKACRSWLSEVIEEKWGWPVASKYQNWQSKSAKAHPRGQGSRSEGNGWKEIENTLAGQGWLLADEEKDLREDRIFGWNHRGWKKKSTKDGKGNNWRDGPTEQRLNKKEGGGKRFGQRNWQKNRGRRQGTGQGEVTSRQQQRRWTRLEPVGDGTQRQGTNKGWKSSGTKNEGVQYNWKGSGAHKVRGQKSWKGSGTKKQNTGDQSLEHGRGQTISNGHGWTTVKNNVYH